MKHQKAQESRSHEIPCLDPTVIYGHYYTSSSGAISAAGIASSSSSDTRAAPCRLDMGFRWTSPAKYAWFRMEESHKIRGFRWNNWNFIRLYPMVCSSLGRNHLSKSRYFPLSLPWNSRLAGRYASLLLVKKSTICWSQPIFHASLPPQCLKEFV